MRLTTKGRFAVAGMIDVAMRERFGPVKLSGISERQAIYISSLEVLFGMLKRRRLVHAKRGPGGGYMLNRRAANITVADILFSIQDPPRKKNADHRNDARGIPERLAIDELWASFNLKAVEFLDSVSLQSLVDNQVIRARNTATCPAPTKPASSDNLGAPRRLQHLCLWPAYLPSLP